MPSSSEKVRVLYHIGYRFPEDAAVVQSAFKSVRVVLLCGTFSRATKLSLSFGPNACNNFSRTDRFMLLRPLPTVLIASHGIGLGSIDCLLNDIHNLLTVANTPSYALIRLGSSGGVGVAPGTLVVTRDALNAALRPELAVTVLGTVRNLAARLDAALSRQLFEFVREHSELPCVMGDTVCAETFFDSQARTDGADPLFSHDDARAYLQRCSRAGVKNIEMECLPLAAFAHRVRVPAAVVCVAFIDRLVEETPTQDAAKLMAYETCAVNAVVEFVKQMLVPPLHDDSVACARSA